LADDPIKKRHKMNIFRVDKNELEHRHLDKSDLGHLHMQQAETQKE
jgi:hypothetical protein